MKRDLQKRIARLRRQMDRALLPLDPAQKETRLAQARQDDFFFYRTYCPFWFTKPSPQFHHALSTAFDVPEDIQAYAAPRHHGKTVIARAKVLKNLCFGLRRHSLLISSTEDMADELAEPLFLQFRENKRLLQDFGELVREGTASDFSLTHGSKFTSRGRNQAIRGLHPDFILLDDVETDAQAKNPERTQDLIRWVFQVLYPMLPPNTEGGGVFVILGTILTRTSMLARFLNLNDTPQPEFPGIVGHIYQAIMTDEHDEERSLWEARWPLDYLCRVRARMTLTAFNSEFQNFPSDEGNIFQADWFKTFTPLQFEAKLSRILHAHGL